MYQSTRDARVDVFELGVAVWMVEAFTRLTVCLQTVPCLVQQGGDSPRAHTFVLPRQFFSQTPRALAGPTERRLGVATRHRLHQRLQRGEQARVGFCHWSPTSSWLAYSRCLRRALCRRLLQFPQPDSNRRARQPGRAGYERYSTPPQFSRFGRGPLSAPPLVQFREQCAVLPLNPFERSGILHNRSSQISAYTPRSICKCYFCASP